eukprot:gene2768-3061_t
MLQAAVLTGCAVVEVMSGCLQVYGALLTPESGPVVLHAPCRVGRALQLAAVAQPPQAAPEQKQPQPGLVGMAAVSPCWMPAALKPRQSGWCLLPGPRPGLWLYLVVGRARVTPLEPVWHLKDVCIIWFSCIALVWDWWIWGLAEEAVRAALVAAAEAAKLGPLSSLAPPTPSPPVVAVLGSKGTGKSAFARLLVNSLLSGGCGAVAFLDLDPGQPELTPPGLLSLHVLQQPLFGPAHLQHRQPLAAYFQQEAEAIYILSCKSGWFGTVGWITGLGLELLAEVLRCAAPTHGERRWCSV